MPSRKFLAVISLTLDIVEEIVNRVAHIYDWKLARLVGYSADPSQLWGVSSIRLHISFYTATHVLKHLIERSSSAIPITEDEKRGIARLKILGEIRDENRWNERVCLLCGS